MVPPEQDVPGLLLRAAQNQRVEKGGRDRHALPTSGHSSQVSTLGILVR